jgi:hypothetical protein
MRVPRNCGVHDASEVDVLYDHPAAWPHGVDHALQRDFGLLDVFQGRTRMGEMESSFAELFGDNILLT